MKYMIGGIAMLLYIGTAFGQTDPGGFIKAQHEREDQAWARKSGLSIAQVRAVRMFVGITDTTNNYVIRNLDAVSLQARHHILLVEGICTRVHVLAPSGDTFTEVWTISSVPDRIWGVSEDPKSRGICRDGQNANAHGTPDGRIVMEVRVRNDPFQRTIPVDTYSFQWNGSKYDLAGSER